MERSLHYQASVELYYSIDRSNRASVANSYHEVQITSVIIGDL